MKKETVSKIPVSKLVMTWILCLFMAVFPWIVSVKQVSAEWGITGASADIVLFCKEIALIIFAAVMVIWLVIERFKLKKYNKGENARPLDMTYCILILIVSITTILSALLSDNKLVAMLGSSTEFEGMWVILSYLVIFYVAYNCICNEKTVKIFQACMIVLVAFVIMFSLIEFLYKPFLMWEPVERIANFFVSFQGLNFVSNTDYNRVVLTFYTSNYYGGFCCLLYPFVYELWIKSETRYARALTMVLNVGMIFCVVVSKSSCALYIWLMEIVVLTVCERKRIIKKWLDVVLLIITTFISFIIINILSDGTFVELGKVIIKNDDTYVETVDEKFIINDIELKESSIVFSGEDKNIVLEYKNELAFYNSKGESLNFVVDEDGWKCLSANGYEMIKVYVGKENDKTKIRRIIVDLGYKEAVDFYLYNGEFYGVEPDGDLTKNIGGSVKGFENMYGYFTGRGYAWINSLPLLKESLILGKGPGHFFYNFKQYDYVGLLKTHGSYKMLIDKPHNTVLQYGVNIGVIGTMAMVGIFILVFISGIKGYKNVKDNIKGIYLSLLVAIMAFFVYSMLNDSIVTVTPYIFMFMGVCKGMQKSFVIF